MFSINKLFNKRKEEIIYFEDFSSLVTDVHSHLIPNIDDGAKTSDDCVQMLNQFKKLGFKKVITTPHIMSDMYRNTSETIERGFHIVEDLKRKNNIEIDIQYAGEYYIDFSFREKMEKEKLLTFGKNYLLIEFSFINQPEGLNQMLFDLQINNYQPVIAHIERFNFWHNKLNIYKELKNRGALFQMNINSITGAYSVQVQKSAEMLLQNNLIDFVGSDAHTPQNIDLMAEARKNKFLADYLKSGNLLNYRL